MEEIVGDAIKINLTSWRIHCRR